MLGNKPWDDPEEKLNKKIRKIARNAAYSIGAAIGIFLIAAIYPKEDGSETISKVMNEFSTVMAVYAAILLGSIILKKKYAPIISTLMTWVIMPTWIGYLVLQYANS
ncbi:MAG: hypothetical protein AB8B83_03990 [Bdellovibrionales bacterium]